MSNDTKVAILKAIKRIALENDGKPPGRRLFERETGTREREWYPDIWLRWGDALREAGFEANELQARLSDDVVLQKYIELARELKHFPVVGEMRRRAREDKSFPSSSVFGRFGGKKELLEAVLLYCELHSGNEDIVLLCEARGAMAKDVADMGQQMPSGFVYLMKSGRHYKIGRTKSLGSRERQLAIQIPIPPKTIHRIETDDPPGVETYWHDRFANKRGEGEWFDLSPDDVRAFKRWKRIF